jgi:predicted Zn-dependent protease
MRGFSYTPADRTWRLARAWARVAMCLLLLSPSGCEHIPESGEGPGRRPQGLALSPKEELTVGKRAMADLMREAGSRARTSGADYERVKHIADRIVTASKIEPLRREINLRVVDHFDWRYTIFDDDRQINAFCLPSGDIGVFTGLLRRLPPGDQNDDKLAAVLAHEVSHALAHHGSERLARQYGRHNALDALAGRFDDSLIGILSAGAQIGSLAYDRRQESEADHIGVFLMTFAGYDPRQAIEFWRTLQRSGRPQPPEVLSGHPSDARRLAQLQAWVPQALAAKRAFDAGHIAPPDR